MNEVRHEVDFPEYKRAEEILRNLNLTWEDLRGKKVLDLGSGDSSLSVAAKRFCPTAQFVSLDIEPQLNTDLHSAYDNPTVQADMDNTLPFADESFDYVIGHASTSKEAIPESTRLLKPGGELRFTPLFSRDFYFMYYYLVRHKGLSEEEAQYKLGQIQIEMNEDENYTSDTYKRLFQETINALSPLEKQHILKQMVDSISKELSISLS